VVHSSGKDVVDVPRLLAASTLRYDDARFFGSFGGPRVAKRYFGILNDMVVPGFTVVDASGHIGASLTAGPSLWHSAWKPLAAKSVRMTDLCHSGAWSDA
jgi:hypothetical protein